MAGIRLTLDRQLPELFVMYPLPWTFPFFSQGAGRIVVDANRLRLTSGDATIITGQVRDLYMYALPWVGITGCDPICRVPDILLRHPLPWRLRRNVVSNGSFPSVPDMYSLHDVCGDCIMAYMADNDKIKRQSRIMRSLARLSYKRYVYDTRIAGVSTYSEWG